MRTHLLLLAACGLGLLVSCETARPPDADAAVYTGTEWQTIDRGHDITVLRDNPPLTGRFDLTGGSIEPTSPDSPFGAVENRNFASAFTWNGAEYRFELAQGSTYQDARNYDGALGVSHVGAVPAPDSGGRWHTNGLLLQPGVPMTVRLRKRRFTGEPYTGRWGWENVGTAYANLTLDPRTIVAGVSVIVVRDGETRPATHRAVAELWLDGRTVDRLQTSTSAGGSLNSYVIDRDPRPLWDFARFDAPAQGSNGPPWVQQVDAPWTSCGRFGKNIQFRLVRYAEVDARDIPGSGGVTSDAVSYTQLEYWIANAASYAESLSGMPSGTRPTIPIVIVRHYGRMGVAETFRSGVIVGENAFSNGGFHPENTIAHELGHFLGIGGTLFTHIAFPPPNLMADLDPTLTESQCVAAYDAARRYSVY